MNQRKSYIYIFVLSALVAVSGNAQVSGTVYFDFNSNGVQDNLEKAFGGITVSAYDATGNLLGTQVTNANGAYSVSASGSVRVEFTGIPTGTYPAKMGSSSFSNVQFVTAPVSGINLGLLNPYHYCQNDPKVISPFYVNGNPMGGGSTGNSPALFSFAYSASGRNNNGGTTADQMALQSQLGAVWGSAYQRETNALFLSPVVRRHSGLGPGGINSIYKVANANSTPTVSPFFNFSTYGFYDFGTDPHSGLPANSNIANNDAGAYDQVGRIGMGDMDISDDGQFLYVINLKTKKLFAVFINNPNRPPTSSLDIEEYSIPNPSCANSEFVPFGLKYYNNKLYVGVLCIAQTSRRTTDLKATVYEFNHITGSFTNVVSGSGFALNYPRGNDGGTSMNWQPWTSSSTMTHQPILSDIEIDPATGEMFVSLMDRTALQWGFQNFGTSGSTATNGLAAGDVLALCKSGSIWTLESNGNYCSKTGSGVGNNQGPGNGEFFNDFTQSATGTHDQPLFGAICFKPGSGEILSTAMDPLSQINSGGLVKYSLANGTQSNYYEVYQSSSVATHGNSGSLGDLELLCDPNPIELGNRVWIDQNENGRQDPGEPGVANQQVQLFSSSAVLLATTTTDANGVYKFNDITAPGKISTGGSYEIRVPITGNLTNLLSTVPNQWDDIIDSDATTTMDKTYAFIYTGLVSYNSHNLDFGFKCATNEVLPQDFEVCLGSTIQLCSDDLGTGATYSWNTGQTSRCITVTVDQVSSYSVSVTAANGCTGSDQVTIGVMDGIFAYAGDDQTVCQGTSVTFTAQAFSGIAPFSYQWNNNLGTSQTITVTPSSTTTYIVTITDNSGCTGTDDVVVNVRNKPNVTASNDVTICLGNSTAISANGSGTTAPYTYSWSNGLGNGQSKTVSPTVNTKYYVTATDLFGCRSLPDSVTVTVAPPINANSSANPSVICRGFSSTLTASGGISYSWSTGGTGSSIVVSPTLTTTYTVTVTGSGGCTASSQVTVNVNPKPSINIQKTDATCGQSNGSATANPTGGQSPYSYSWSNGFSTQTINNLSAGTYTVTVTDNNSCSNTSSVTINSVGTVSVNAGLDKTICSGSNTSLTATPSNGTSPYTFNWSSGQTGQTITVSPTNTTSYTVTVTDNNNCTATDNVTVFVNPKPSINIQKTDATCGQSNGSATANPTGGQSPYSYSWSNGFSTQTINNLSAGTYTVTVTDNNSCSNTSSVTINSVGTVSVNAGLDKTICSGSNTSLTATPSNGTSPYSFSWSSGQTGQTITVSPTNTTSYTVTVTDNNNCTATDNVTVFVNPKPSINFQKTDATCGQSNGSATANPTGGQSPYSYSWSNGYTTQTINNLSAGTYTVTVTDNNSCSNTNLVSIANIPAPTVDAGSNQQICANSTTTLTATPSGGSSPYQFLWSTGETSQSIQISTNLTKSYKVTITDQNNCTAIDSVIVFVLPCGSIGNFVWEDVNGNGIQEIGENGLGGITVQLYYDNDVFVKSKVTNSFGYYLFDTLNFGSYYIKVILPTNYKFSPKHSGSDELIDSDVSPITGLTDTFDISSMNPNLSLDFGLYNPAVIGDYVWYDEGAGNNMNNGIQNNNELAAENVKLYLYSGAGELIDSTISDQNGRYQFLAPQGSFYLKAVLPQGKILSPADQGNNDLKDSDFTQAQGPLTTSLFTVVYNIDNSSIDLGIVAESLPLVLLDFNGHSEDSKDILHWQTTSEIGVKQVCLEQKFESAVSFTELVCYDQFFGSSVNKFNYKVDFHYYNGEPRSYRLRIDNEDGSREYSHIVVLRSDPTHLDRIELYPNPAQDYIVIKSKELKSIKIYDLGGKLIKAVQKMDEQNELKIDISTLEPGMYKVELRLIHKSLINKLIKGY